MNTLCSSWPCILVPRTASSCPRACGRSCLCSKIYPYFFVSGEHFLTLFPASCETNKFLVSARPWQTEICTPAGNFLTKLYNLYWILWYSVFGQTFVDYRKLYLLQSFLYQFHDLELEYWLRVYCVFWGDSYVDVHRIPHLGHPTSHSSRMHLDFHYRLESKTSCTWHT